MPTFEHEGDLVTYSDFNPTWSGLVAEFTQPFPPHEFEVHLREDGKGAWTVWLVQLAQQDPETGLMPYEYRLQGVYAPAVWGQGAERLAREHWARVCDLVKTPSISYGEDALLDQALEGSHEAFVQLIDIHEGQSLAPAERN